MAEEVTTDQVDAIKHENTGLHVVLEKKTAQLDEAKSVIGQLLAAYHHGRERACDCQKCAAVLRAQTFLFRLEAS